MTVTPGDLLAALDVISEVAREAEGVPLDDAIALRHVLGQLADETKRANMLLETAMTAQLEQPRAVDGVFYEVKDKGVTRFDHDEIARHVLDRIRVELVDHETGEIPDMEPAEKAWRAFKIIYLSGSSSAKQSALKQLVGITNIFDDKVAHWARTGTKIVETPLGDI
jgi:hypothetical protein